MKIVIAPDSFKGSLSAFEVARSIERGIKNVSESIDTVIVPMADGGEGTVQALIDASGGEIINLTVHDPLFREIQSFYGIMGDGKTAVIEMAAASGLPLLKPEERNPFKTTTYGTGELIKDALDKGCQKLIIGLGGSATNDGGCGMAQALGIKYMDSGGNEIDIIGGELSRISHIDLTGIDPRIGNAEFLAACDVDNPLCGERGASAAYGPQKGATKKDVITLDKALEHFSEIVRIQLNVDIKDKTGAGAAGGLGAGAMIFLNAQLQSGIEIIEKITNLSEKMNGADLVITGEGKIDFQTARGKVPFGVAQTAKEKNIPVIALAGGLGQKYKDLYTNGFDGIFSITDKPMTLQKAVENAALLLEDAAENLIRFWISNMYKK